MKRLLPHIAAALVAVQLLIIFVSWLLSAAYPTSELRSLLSSEGLRWFFGQFNMFLSRPLLVDLLLLSMAWGVLRKSGMLSYRSSYRESRARMMTLFLLAVYIGVLLLLTVIPHAVLLSATGHLWPSPFSRSIVSVVAFTVLSLSAFYGTIAGYFNTIADVMRDVDGNKVIEKANADCGVAAFCVSEFVGYTLNRIYARSSKELKSGWNAFVA